MFPSNQRQITEEAVFAYCPLGKTFEKWTKKQVAALKSTNISNRKDKLKQFRGIFLQNLMNDLIRVKLKQIGDITKFDEWFD